MPARIAHKSTLSSDKVVETSDYSAVVYVRFEYTDISRKVVEKVHATNPKGVVGGFKFTVI